ncbi:phosphoglycerate mutase family protein [Caenispirillum salinarum AK4]|uniref:Phosphoglycerate mutase family protein n=1 Tax=Caenispirillum salinarum AK4 TaxID=1238182 RepID=K9HGA8_9PROT|nr:histidine phosphatase family protein [Caenispirillum salinarum]EKV27636.1 phosphoglycerate mutase family protein [Caenispirillum salinarum AK4]
MSLEETPEQPVAGRRRLIFMRHGEVLYLGEDGRPVHPKHVQLTPRGLAQAEAARELLAGAPPDLVLASPKERSRRTAEIAGGGRPVREEPALTEIRSGNALRLPPARFDAEFTYGFETAAEPGALFCGGEPFATFADRAMGVVHRLLREPGWSTALIVSHEGVNRVMLSWAVGAGLSACGVFDQDMGCLNIIDVDTDKAGTVIRTTLKAVNVTPCDPAKTGRRLTSMERLGADLRPFCATTDDSGT